MSASPRERTTFSSGKGIEKIMNKQLKEKWVAALNSDKYRQCKGKLHIRYDKTFCALGVLADVMQVNWDEVKDDEEVYKIISSEAKLDNQDQLIEWNDDEELDFHEIANRIIEEIPGDE